MTSPFHEGELIAQERAGELMTAEMNSPMISDRVMPGAFEFLKAQRLVAVGTVAEDGRVWASVVLGEPGFVRVLSARQVRLELAAATKRDILWANLRKGAHLGMLAIDLATRRRLRVNGVVSNVNREELILDVREAYPNCPKFIQRRVQIPGTVAPIDAEAGEELNAAVTRLIQAADTMFIASDHAGRGADVSHRGGKAGFVQVLDERTLRIPDYPGNGMFNTMGNLITNPRAGLAVLDFESGRMAQLTGRAQAVIGETERYIEFAIERWQLLPLEARWRFVDASPYNPAL